MKKRFVVWGTGGLFYLLLLILAGNSMLLALFSGADDYWWQMWCYVFAAIAGLLIPWLISLRTKWSARLCAVLSLLASVALLVVCFGVFRYPLYGPLFDDWPTVILGNLFMWGAAIAFLLISVFCCFRRNLREATSGELYWLRRVGCMFLSLVVGFALMALLYIGALAVAIYEENSLFKITLAYICVISSFTLYIWPVAELLPRGVWRRVCFRILLYGVTPGLLASAPSYFIGFPTLGFHGEEYFPLRIAVSLALLCGTAGIVWFILRRIKES